MKKHQGIFKILFLLVLLPLAGWHLGIKKTIELHHNCLEQKQKLAQASALQAPASKSPAPVLGESLISNGKILQLIHDSLSAHHVNVVEFTPKKIDSQNEYALYNGELLLSGNYISLVKVISAIERLNLPIKIRSAEFAYNKEKKEFGKAIKLILLLQQIESAS